MVRREIGRLERPFLTIFLVGKICKLKNHKYKVYETTIQTSIQNIMVQTEGDNSFLSAVGQMTLCFFEFFVLMILSLLAKIIDVQVFKIIFILSIFATIIINLKINIKVKKSK